MKLSKQTIVKEILTRLRTTQIDEQKVKIEERETIDDNPTRTENTRSKHNSTSKCKKHRQKVNSEPDP